MPQLIFVTAFLVRLINLNQSLWLDEGTTAKVTHLSFLQILLNFSPTDFHPPLYYFFMKIWTSVFGASEIALRFPSILFSLIAGYVVYLIGKKLQNKQAGTWAAAFFLFNPLIMYYSQEARMYLMATCILMLAFYFYLFLLDKKTSVTHIVLCNVCIALSFATFYGSVFFISAFYIYLLLSRRIKQHIWIHPGFLLPFILLLPLLIKQLGNARESMKVVVNWSQVLGRATVKNLLLIPLKFSIGRISFEPKSLYYIISVPWTIFIWFLALKQWSKHKMLTFFLLFPLALGLIFSVFSPLLQYFRFIYLVPILCLLLAVSLKNNILKSVVLGGFVLFSLAYLCLPQFQREDWKSLANSLAPAQSVYMIPSSADALLYYRPDVKIAPIDQIDRATGQTLAVVPYALEIYGFNHRPLLEKKKYHLTKTSAYRGLTIEQYSK